MVCERKVQKRERAMTSAEYVDRARGWADTLVWKECRGPGDMAEARARVEARYGIPAAWLKDLRHRPPKRIGVDLYERLRIAYLNHCERIIQAAAREIEATKQEHPHADLSGLENEAQSVVDAIAAARSR